MDTLTLATYAEAYATNAMLDRAERELIASQMRTVVRPALDFWAVNETDRRSREMVIIEALIDAGWRPKDRAVCAWCEPTPAGQKVSHTICPSCEAKYFPEPFVPRGGTYYGQG